MPELMRVEVTGVAPTALAFPTTSVTLQLEVPMALVTLQLEVPTASMTSSCPGPAVRVESIVEATRIHHLEVPTTLASLPLQIAP
jgi:hypothetical protein